VSNCEEKAAREGGNTGMLLVVVHPGMRGLDLRSYSTILFPPYA